MTYDKSDLMRQAWRLARILDEVTGEGSRSALVCALKFGWECARAARSSAPAMVPQQAQQQQARDTRSGLTVVTNPNPPTHCSHCGRRLTDHVSVRHGIGPVCRANGAAPARDLFTTRADYTVEDLLDVILVVDLDKGGRSVTNDAEGVIEDLRRAGLIRPGVPVVYRDSTGTWDRLAVKDGRFAGFVSIGAKIREEAIARARGAPPPRHLSATTTEDP